MIGADPTTKDAEPDGDPESVMISDDWDDGIPIPSEEYFRTALWE